MLYSTPASMLHEGMYNMRLGHSYTFSIVNCFVLFFAASVFISPSVSSTFVSISPTVQVQCVARNLMDILCRWEKDSYPRIIGVKFSTKNSPVFQECVESTEPSVLSYSSCVLDYPSAWVNETLSIEIVSSHQSTNTTTLIDFNPKEHLILSPPVVKFKRRQIGRTVHVTMNVSFQSQEIKEKVLSNCGSPEGQVVYELLYHADIKEYSDENSWSIWRKGGNESWFPRPGINSHTKEKRFKNVHRQVDLGLLNITDAMHDYLAQVRWKVSGSLCQGGWGPFRNASFRTRKFVISPTNVELRPGGNVTLTCESTKHIKNFMWTVSDGNGGELLTYGRTSEDGYISHLFFNDTSDIRRTVECWSNETKGDDGMTAVIYDAPPPPTVQCLLQNKEKMYCRYSICNFWIEKQQGRVPNNFTFSWDYSEKHGHQNHTLLHICTFSDVVTEDMKYFMKSMRVSVNSSNTIGWASTSIEFQTDHLIKPTSPVLNVSSVSSNRQGATLIMTATSHNSDSSSRIHPHCRNFTLNIRWLEISELYYLSKTKFPTNSEFWNNWRQWKDHLNKQDEVQMNGAYSKQVIAQMTNGTMGTSYDEHDYIKFEVPGLASNTWHLIEVKWKLISHFCNGYWSVPQYKKVKIGNLMPPGFLGVSVAFLSENSAIRSNFLNSKWSTDTFLVVWDAESIANSKVQERNTYEYRLVESNESCTKERSSKIACNSLVAPWKHDRTSRVNVNVSNNIGYEISPTIQIIEMGTDTCVARVVSLSLESSQESSLHFKVGWIYAKSSPPCDCDVSLLETRIKVHLLTWKENCSICTDYTTSRKSHLPRFESASNASVYYFNLTIEKSSARLSEHVIKTHVTDFSNSTSFAYPFQSDVAYGIGVSLSERSSQFNLSKQSATVADANLYYFQNDSKKSKGAPEILTVSEIGRNQIKISWRPSKPQERRGPVLRYEIYVRNVSSCSFRHDASVCDWTQVDVDRCYKKPDKIYELSNLTKFGGWESEERNNSHFMYAVLEGLPTGTTYYISVWEVTKAGRNKCFRHITVNTNLHNYVWIVSVLTCIFTFTAVILLITFRRRVKKVFKIDLPQPRLWINWKDIDDDMQPSVATNLRGVGQRDDESNSYVALTRQPQTNNSFHDLMSHTESNLDETPRMITLSTEECRESDFQKRTSSNNNETQKTPRPNYEFDDRESYDVRVTSTDSLGKTSTEGSSVGSEEPCCSVSSTGNVGGSWPYGNSACEEENEDTYVSANEAASMSWLLGLENNDECLLEQFI